MSVEDEARRLAREWMTGPNPIPSECPAGRQEVEWLAAKLAPILAERDEALYKLNQADDAFHEERQRIAELEATLRDLTNLKSADVQRIAELEAEVERLQQTLPPSRWHVTELDTRWQGLVEKWQGAKREAREVKARLDAILGGERRRLMRRRNPTTTYSDAWMPAAEDEIEPAAWEVATWVRLPEREK